MFESDDFDQVLSQFDFPEVEIVKPQEIVIQSTVPDSPDYIDCTNESTIRSNKFQSVTGVILSPPKIFKNTNANNNVTEQQHQTASQNHCEKSSRNQLKNTRTQPINLTTNGNKESTHIPPVVESFLSPKHLKRNIINSHFDQQRKRKFPGPAGLLTGVLHEARDEGIGQIELLSQDMDFTESNLRPDLFESPLWKRLLSDTRDWRVQNVDTIKDIKQQALTGNLRRRKAQAVTAFIEAVDRSVTDPLIILRDESGSIQCTLHRDAWTTFSPYIISEYCALVLQKPTVLTTGGAFKKHYLNITLGNILAIFSTAVLEEERVMPDGYRILCKENLTVIKAEICSENIEPPLDTSNSTEDLFDGLDNFFTDELF